MSSIGHMRTCVLLLALVLVVHGGEDQTKEAPKPVVSLTATGAALRFFTKNQHRDGFWEVGENGLPSSPLRRGLPGFDRQDGRVALTALVIRCFLNEGYDHKTPHRHKNSVKIALAWLVSQQDPDGSYGSSTLAHIYALGAVAIAYAMTTDPGLKAKAQLGVEQLLARRLRDPGSKPVGWGDARGVSTVLTFEATLALKVSTAAKLPVEDSIERIRAWHEQVWWEANPQWASLDPWKDESHFPAWRKADGQRQGEEIFGAAAMAALLRSGDSDVMRLTLGNRLRSVINAEPERIDDPYDFLLAHVAHWHGDHREWWWKQRWIERWTTAQVREEGELFGSWNPAGGAPSERWYGSLAVTRAFSLHYQYHPEYFVP